MIPSNSNEARKHPMAKEGIGVPQFPKPRCCLLRRLCRECSGSSASKATGSCPDLRAVCLQASYPAIEAHTHTYRLATLGSTITPAPQAATVVHGQREGGHTRVSGHESAGLVPPLSAASKKARHKNHDPCYVSLMTVSFATPD